MTHDDTRDNCTNLEAALIAADAHEDTREDVGGATWHECECEACTEDDGQPSEYEEWQDYFGGDEYYDHSENGGW